MCVAFNSTLHNSTSQLSVSNCFIRGSVVRYVVVCGGVDVHPFPCFFSHAFSSFSSTQLPEGSVDVELLHDATRREARGQ